MTMKHEDSDSTVPSNLPIDSFLSLISADSVEVILKELVERTKEWMHVSQAALWWLDLNHNGFRMVPAGKSGKKNSSNSFIPYETADELGLVSAEEPVEISEDASCKPHGLDLRGSLAARINYYERTSGILVVFPYQHTDSWSDSDRELLKLIARTGAELCKNFEKREKLERLVDSLQEMTEKTTGYDLYDLVLREARAILQCDRGVMRGMNLQNGHLTYEVSIPKAPVEFTLPPGEGITGLALEERRTYRIPDVTTEEWAKRYRRLWPNLRPTRSELALPILLRSRVRVKKSDEYVNKPFGVLNFESPTITAFSSWDQYCGEIIAQRIAPIMERIEYDSKLGKVRRASQSLATKRDWDQIVDTLLNEIHDSLGYEFVSLSIVDHDAGLIRCVRVLGLGDTEAAEFKKLAVHKLDSDHVQADVVRYRRTEVPSPEDPRLSEISNRFGLDKLIRVFIPVAVPQREVIGTITAGYERKYREHIYWRDVQLLKILAVFAANAMVLWQRDDIDRVSHEMNAPLTAVRANLENLRKKHRQLPPEEIGRDLEDMETDANLLYFQVQQLEYVLAGRVAEAARQPLHLESVRLFSDIIFKTISQLRMLVRDEGLDPKKITYVEEQIHNIPKISVDKSKISQVIFNLFMNAVKYVDNPETFKIVIGAEDQPRHYVIKFCDWGIGVPEGLEEKIFEDRFRAPLVRGVRGSGLGLTIARQLMRKHGGDLVLHKRKDPTEFHLLFPKTVKERS